jgi:hypothetical protein
LVLNTAKDSCSIGQNIYKPQLHELHHTNIVNYLSLLNHKNKFLFCVTSFLLILQRLVDIVEWLYHCYTGCIAHSLNCVCDIKNILAFGCISTVRWLDVLILIFVLCFISRDHSDSHCSYVPIFIILANIHDLPHIPIIIIY